MEAIFSYKHLRYVKFFVLHFLKESNQSFYTFFMLKKTKSPSSKDQTNIDALVCTESKTPFKETSLICLLPFSSVSCFPWTSDGQAVGREESRTRVCPFLQ